MARIVNWRVLLVVAGLLVSGRSLGAQSAAGTGLPPTAAATAGSAASAAPAPKLLIGKPAAAQPGTQGLPEKQTALAQQTEKLLAMATALKAQVDKTNRDILSCAVVAQAQAIEQYAHQLKQGEAKK